MAPHWQVALSATGAALAALAGAFAGALLTGRNQQSQWTRDQRLAATVQILTEYSKIYHNLYYWAVRGQKVQIDWTTWNGALAVLGVTAEREVAEASIDIDRAFWEVTNRVEAGETGPESWPDLRSGMEEAIVRFINTCRRQFLHDGGELPAIIGRRERHVDEISESAEAA